MNGKSAVEFVRTNCPSAVVWNENSFLGKLENSGIWNWEEYWEFESALYSLGEVQLDRGTLAAIFKIYSRLIRLFSSHRDSNDIFEFKNLTFGELDDLEERIELVFEGVFVLKMPLQSLFSRGNPLL